MSERGREQGDQRIERVKALRTRHTGGDTNSLRLGAERPGQLHGSVGLRGGGHVRIPTGSKNIRQYSDIAVVCYLTTV